jgi:hypothetical protein
MNKTLKISSLFTSIFLIILIICGCSLSKNKDENSIRDNGDDYERQSEIASLLTAIYQHQTASDVKGTFPVCKSNGKELEIPECGEDFSNAIEFGTDAKALDCSESIIPHGGFGTIPYDPTNGTEARTGYFTCRINAEKYYTLYVIAPYLEYPAYDYYPEYQACKNPMNPAKIATCVKLEINHSIK